MISVGIDVSKGKSTVFAMNETGTVYQSQTEYEHTRTGMEELVEKLKAFPEVPRVVMESTGYYHWPVVNSLLEAGIFVCVVNPILMSKFSKVQMRPGKTDRLDAVMICKFGLARWNDLSCCNPNAADREQLKLYSRQYTHFVRLMVEQKVNFGSLLDETMPGIQTLLRDEGGRSKLCDFALEFWHFDLFSRKKPEIFINAYCKWAKKKGYHVNESKAQKIYDLSQNGIPLLPSTQAVKLCVQEAARTLKHLEDSVASILSQMNALASTFPEYETVISMKGVGPRTAPRRMAEIGDVSRFHSAKALVAYAGLDAPSLVPCCSGVSFC